MDLVDDSEAETIQTTQRVEETTKIRIVIEMSRYLFLQRCLVLYAFILPPLGK